MNILIIGGSGLVGSNFIQHLISLKKYNWLATHYTFETQNTFYLDTIDSQCINDSTIVKFKPDVVIHTGALTHVDLCEKEKEKSFLQTVVSTQNALEIAKKHSAKFVYISSDYVFDGRSGPYNEDAETNPESVYGKHKLKAEKLVYSSSLDYIILRITNVYGEEIRRKNFVARIADMAKKKEHRTLTLPYDQYATPVNAYDVARCGMMLLKNRNSGIFHIGSTDYMNRVQLAQTILNHFPEHNLKVKPVDTKTLDQEAPRPLQGGLKSSKFLSIFPGFEFSSVNSFLKAH